MNLRIEPARPEHKAVVERFVAAIQDHERPDVPELRPGTEIAADYAAWITEMVQANDGVLLLAWDGATPVGLVAAWKGRDDDRLLRAEHREHAYISDLFVAETHRRRRIARQLLAQVEAAMRARGCRRLRLNVKAANRVAIAFYETEELRAYEVAMWKPLDRSG